MAKRHTERGGRLAGILADMVRSAMAWEEEHHPPPSESLNLRHQNATLANACTEGRRSHSKTLDGETEPDDDP